jgi:bifunctional non-homologous end joining protein LigD
MADLPRLIRPMMATLRREVPPDEGRYGWELKWDGVRAIAYVADGRVRLVSRNDKDMTGSYPELTALGAMCDTPVVLDGEIVALRDGRPDFGLLQSRMHVQRPAESLLRAAPVAYYVFDLLHEDEEPLLSRAYPERRDRLAALRLDTTPVRTPPWWRGGAADVLAASIAQGLEGIVGKPLTSQYHPGKRRDWIKVKNVRHQEVVIAGWKPGEGRRQAMIGSLLLGVHRDDRLTYVGNVGTGFTEGMLRNLAADLAPLERDTSPLEGVPRVAARGVHWVEPRLVGEVAFSEWTPDGHLRHPSWRGLRPDKSPEEVRREDAM